MEILFSSEYLLFTQALGLFVLLVVVETVGFLVAGAGLSDAMDSVIDTDGLPENVLTNWIMVKEIPLSIVLMLAALGFGGTGFLVQGVSTALEGHPTPAFIVGILATFGALLTVRIGGKLLAPLFKTETSAVSEFSLIGRTAVLISPRAYTGFAGEARLLDEHGQPHFVMIEPADKNVQFVEGARLQLVSKDGVNFLAKQVD